MPNSQSYHLRLEGPLDSLSSDELATMTGRLFCLFIYSSSPCPNLARFLADFKTGLQNNGVDIAAFDAARANASGNSDVASSQQSDSGTGGKKRLPSLSPSLLDQFRTGSSDEDSDIGTALERDNCRRAKARRRRDNLSPASNNCISEPEDRKPFDCTWESVFETGQLDTDDSDGGIEEVDREQYDSATHKHRQLNKTGHSSAISDHGSVGSADGPQHQPTVTGNTAKRRSSKKESTHKKGTSQSRSKASASQAASASPSRFHQQQKTWDTPKQTTGARVTRTSLRATLQE